ncbi:MAG: hypothetical protein NDI68_06295, partial [Arenimonas sp.]|nr:hypothetical protein [Arenimonas sp.]
GLKNGDRIAIAGVTGNTGANGIWTVASVGATSLTLLGSVGNGTHGGTVRVGVVMDATPHMQRHSLGARVWGNGVATLVVENYGSYTDFAAGVNADATLRGTVAPSLSPSTGTNTNGNATTTAASTTITLTAANAGLPFEVRPSLIMRAVLSAWTSGTVGLALNG